MDFNKKIMENDNLENYYPGDDSWHRFAMLFADEWANCLFKDELLSALNDNEDIAMVIYASVRQNALQWIDESVPALNSITPRECMKTEDGRKRLKTMLTRMPR